MMQLFTLFLVLPVVWSTVPTTGPDEPCFSAIFIGSESHVKQGYICYLYEAYLSDECHGNNNDNNFPHDLIVRENEDSSPQPCPEEVISDTFNEFFVSANNENCSDLDLSDLCDMLNPATSCNVEVTSTDTFDPNKMAFVMKFEGESSVSQICLNNVDGINTAKVAFISTVHGEQTFHQASVHNGGPNVCVPPTPDPTQDPTADPTHSPTTDPTQSPSTDPTDSPSTDPTGAPTTDPTVFPTASPTNPCEDYREICENVEQFLDGPDECDIFSTIGDDIVRICELVKELCVDDEEEGKKCKTGDCQISTVKRNGALPSRYILSATRINNGGDTFRREFEGINGKTFEEICTNAIKGDKDKGEKVPRPNIKAEIEAKWKISITVYFDVEFNVTCCAKTEWEPDPRRISESGSIEISYQISVQIISVKRTTKKADQLAEWTTKLCTPISQKHFTEKQLKNYEAQAIENAVSNGELDEDYVKDCYCRKHGGEVFGSGDKEEIVVE